MNYYEELGLTKSATREEIRQAYRNLVRLLHPDRQPDPVLRRLAECQMKRVNQVIAALTDCDARREYDATLEDAGPARACELARSVARFARERWFWLALAGIAAAALCWDLGGRSEVVRGPAPTAAATEKPGPPPSPAREREGRRGRKRRPDMQEARASEEASPAAAPAPPDIELAETDWRSVHDRIRPPDFAPARRQNVREAVRAGFAGHWLYAPAPATEESAGLYPPEYIELVLSQQAGRLVGRYRARYRIADRPVSPDVVFRLEGVSSGETARLRWTASDGGNGESELRRVGPRAIEMRWWATQLGHSSALASGTAVLVRREEP